LDFWFTIDDFQSYTFKNLSNIVSLIENWKVDFAQAFSECGMNRKSNIVNRKSMSHLIKNATVINEGRRFTADVRIEGNFIKTISETPLTAESGENITDATGKYLIPGAIDDQVHFREPGLTHKADVHSESRAAIAGGITSFMEMPNTNPQTLTQDLLAQKYQMGAEKSMANFSFFMGASNDNLGEVLKTNPKDVCGIKVFMGSSTGNMLVDDQKTLDGIFKECEMLIALHCEKEAVIRENLAFYKAQYPQGIPVTAHPKIRNAEACYASSSEAVALAEKYGTRIHILHISTAKETSLFRNDIPLSQKKITAEACVHHLWFSDADYATRGNFIKWNPAVKSAADRDAIRAAVIDGRIDVLATDHAPHTLEEKSLDYEKAPSGGPLVQHALPALFELTKQHVFTPELIVQKFSHNVADLFQVDRRGYIREGYFADLVLVDPAKPGTVSKTNVLYKCGWSPFEGDTFAHSVTHTWVNGNLVYENGIFDESSRGMRLLFNR